MAFPPNKNEWIWPFHTSFENLLPDLGLPGSGCEKTNPIRVEAIVLGWRPSLLGWRPSLLGWRPWEAIALRLEAIAIRLEAITIRLEAITWLEAMGGHRS